MLLSHTEILVRLLAADGGRAGVGVPFDADELFRIGPGQFRADRIQQAAGTDGQLRRAGRKELRGRQSDSNHVAVAADVDTADLDPGQVDAVAAIGCDRHGPGATIGRHQVVVLLFQGLILGPLADHVGRGFLEP